MLHLDPVSADKLLTLCTTEPFGTLLKHPLVTTVLSDQRGVDHALEIISWKQQEVRAALESARWSKAIVLYEKPYRPAALKALADRMADSDYWLLVAQTWIQTEYPHKQQDVWASLLTAARPGRVEHGMSADDQRHHQALPEVVAVWRGALTRSHVLDGFSWTEDAEQARWFADRLGSTGSGVVVSGTVRKRDVLLTLRSRGESELLCSPGSVAT